MLHKLLTQNLLKLKFNLTLIHSQLKEINEFISSQITGLRN
jgi:hypothetical protein